AAREILEGDLGAARVDEAAAGAALAAAALARAAVTAAASLAAARRRRARRPGAGGGRRRPRARGRPGAAVAAAAAVAARTTAGPLPVVAARDQRAHRPESHRLAQKARLHSRTSHGPHDAAHGGARRGTDKTKQPGGAPRRDATSRPPQCCGGALPARAAARIRHPRSFRAEGPPALRSADPPRGSRATPG